MTLAARAPEDAAIGFEELDGAPALVVRAPSLDLVLTALDRAPSNTNWA